MARRPRDGGSTLRLCFLGTRGNTEVRSPRHDRHSALLVGDSQARVMIDCGEDWLGTLDDLRPAAVLVTHGHPDHAWGLRGGAPCPVYATEPAAASMVDYGLGQLHVIPPRQPVEIAGLTVEAFPVEHSTRAPAAGYRVACGDVAVFYVPDVVYIHDRRAALASIRLYIGDGATVARPMVRKRGEALIGHVPIRTQLTWCRQEGVPRAVFTHCGSELIGGDEGALARRVAALGEERGVTAEIAHDGLAITL